MKRVRSTTVLLLILVLAPSATMVPCVLGAEDSWKTKASTMQRRELGVTSVNGKVYAVGGLDRETCLKNNMEYDHRTDEWTSRAAMPTARANVAVVACQNKVYVIGGSIGAGALERYGSGSDYTKNSVTAANEAYDTETDTWTTKEPMPKPRWSASASVVNEKIYVFGGFKADGTPTNDTQVYDPETDSWTEKASMPTRLGGQASAAVNSSIYVFGGTTQWITGSKSDFALVYDTKNDSWSYASPMPRAPSFPAAAATTGLAAPQRVYVISYPNITQVYNPENDSWSTGAEMHSNRCTFGVAAVNDRLYVVGGGSALFPEVYFSGENEEYTPFGYIPEFQSWIVVPLFLVATLVAVTVKRKACRPI